MRVYFDCLKACQASMSAAVGGGMFDRNDHLVFHLGGSPKFVRHAFEEMYAAAHEQDGVDDDMMSASFQRLVEPSLQLAARIGPMHTSAAYVNLCSLLLHDPPPAGARIGIFSFGSGASCSMFHLRVCGAAFADRKVLQRLDQRVQLEAHAFFDMVKRYTNTYRRFNWTPKVTGAPVAPSYRIKQVKAYDLHREYEFLLFSIIGIYSSYLDLPVDASPPGGSQPVSAALQQLLAALGGTAMQAMASQANVIAQPSLDVGAILPAIAQELIGTAVAADAPLMEAGLDSLGATELRCRLQQQLGGGISLPETLVFDFPTLRQIEEHVQSSVRVSVPTSGGQGAPAVDIAGLLSQLRGASAPVATTATLRVDVGAILPAIAQELIGTAVAADAPLMEAGLDSLGATELRCRLQQQLGGGISLPETLVFDFPTLRQIEEHVQSSVRVSVPTSGGQGAPAVDIAGLLSQLRGASAPVATTATLRVDVGAILPAIAQELIGTAVAADAPLMEAGLDSLGATELRCRLQQQLGGGISLPETLVFDFPTLRQIEEHVQSSVRVSVPTSGGQGALAVDIAGLLSQLRGASAPVATTATLRVDVGAILPAIAQELIGTAVAADAPLMEAGLDSLGATELRCRLQQQLGGGISLPETLVFDFPTLRQIEEHVQSSVRVSVPTSGGQGAPAVDIAGLLASVLGSRPAASCNPSRPATEGVSVLGWSVTLPGGVRNIEVAWQMTTSGTDAITEVPSSRWQVSVPESSPAQAQRYGGFLSGADRFDNVVFNISSAEAATMDPQQRLMLEHGYQALHAASIDRNALLGSVTGVFVGVAVVNFEDYLDSKPDMATATYAATGGGSGLSIVSGRLSYTLGLHGPALSIDTACSAGLTAVHCAYAALKQLQCHTAVMGGVNMMLSNKYSVRFALVGMTSPSGRCYTFDARADGYSRSEGCCAISAARGDGAAMAIGGSAIRQDGRSASLTAPNGQAQRGLVDAALAELPIPPDTITSGEAHGTGTPLGDPIEAGSIAASVVRKRMAPDGFFAWGAGKVVPLPTPLTLKLHALAMPTCPANLLTAAWSLPL